MEEYNIIGKDIYFGRLKEQEFDDGSMEICFEILEGKVKEVICFDAFSPSEVIIDGKEYFLPMSMDEYYMISDGKEELGFHICNMSRESLLKDLCKRYNALILSRNTLHWLMDYDHDYIPVDEDCLPNVFTLKKGEYVMTDDDIEQYLVEDDSSETEEYNETETPAE